MPDRVRPLDHTLRERLQVPRQTIFVTGPRQVGKTTPCRLLATAALDWHDTRDRRAILRGPAAAAERLGLERLREREAVILLDNLTSYGKWPGFLRGLRSRAGARLRVLVTGLGADRRRPGANSCSLRLHPWSVGECVRGGAISAPLQPPAAISDEDWNALLEHGGFPEPFLQRDSRFTRRWLSRRRAALVVEDLRGLAAVQDPQVLQTLTLLLAERSGGHLFYSHLSRELSVTVDTVRRWIELLIRAQYGFLVRPWSNGVPKALCKEPKWFLRDWAGIGSRGDRRLTFIACHLLKAVDGWSDLGFGRFELCYVRDKLKREVDFLVVRDRRPWFLVAVSDEPGPAQGSAAIAPALTHFQACTRASHAFQVTFDGPFAAADCFEKTTPAAVSARTFLSQLL